MTRIIHVYKCLIFWAKKYSQKIRLIVNDVKGVFKGHAKFLATKYFFGDRCRQKFMNMKIFIGGLAKQMKNYLDLWKRKREVTLQSQNLSWSKHGDKSSLTMPRFALQRYWIIFNLICSQVLVGCPPCQGQTIDKSFLYSVMEIQNYGNRRLAGGYESLRGSGKKIIWYANAKYWTKWKCFDCKI